MKGPIPSLPSGMLAATFFLIAFSVPLGAQQSPSPNVEAQRGDALKNLAYFVGSWTMDGYVKLPEALGPPRKITLHQHCEWLTPQSFLVCHADSAGAGRSASGLLVIGYNTNDKAYTYDDYSSSGAAQHWTGAFESDTFGRGKPATKKSVR